MKLRHLAAIASVATALASCGPMSSATIQELNVQDWIGHSSDRLVQSWGKPDRSHPTADGGTVIAYSFANPAVTGPKSQVIFRATECTVNFTADRNGVIDDVSSTSGKCRIGSYRDRYPPPNRT
jgi:hypothetical protein